MISKESQKGGILQEIRDVMPQHLMFISRFQSFYFAQTTHRYQKGKTSLDLNKARDDGGFAMQ